MELNYFLSVLSRRKWLLLAVMLLTAATTYFAANQLPKKYKSSAVIATGILDFKGIRVGEVNPFVQEFEIEGKFSNLTEYMKSRPSYFDEAIDVT
jgi:polysaccharide biosynthesis transport protein